MEALSSLMYGFGIALQPDNLIWCIVGCFLGTIVGILPGLGPAATLSMLLPLTYNMDPAGAIIMLAGIYYGAKYGGSTTSILLNMPGESSSVVSCIDGYQMARNGRAGAALGIAAISSFVAGTVGVILLTLIAPPIAEFALAFGPPEYFALMFLGLSLVVLLSGASLIKGFLSLMIGLWLASVGTDLFSAQSRFTFGFPQMVGGLEFIVIAIGIFAITEVLMSIDAGEKTQLLPIPKGFRNLLPSKVELKSCRFAFLNGSITGFIVGVLPGAGATISSFLAYGLEKAVSRHPEKFGQGAPEGLAAPEGANNADTGGALVPLLTLGIPGSGSTAILLSALILWGYRPGPMLMVDAPDVFWGLVASMYIGNLVLVIMNLPMVPLFAQILRIPLHTLYPIIFGLSIVGAYGVSERVFDVGLLVLFGLLGYAMAKLKYPPAPLILGFVLGDAMERALRQTMIMFQGDMTTFVTRPLSAAMMAVGFLILLAPLVSWFSRTFVNALGNRAE